jgi:hypothetical protein
MYFLAGDVALSNASSNHRAMQESRSIRRVKEILVFCYRNHTISRTMFLAGLNLLAVLERRTAVGIERIPGDGQAQEEQQEDIEEATAHHLPAAGVLVSGGGAAVLTGALSAPAGPAPIAASTAEVRMTGLSTSWEAL